MPEDERFDLIMIHPSLIFGPPLLKDAISLTFMIKDMVTESKKVKNMTMDFVDVRDVA